MNAEVLRMLRALGVLGVLGCSSSGCTEASALPPRSLPVTCSRSHLPAVPPGAFPAVSSPGLSRGWI